MHSSRKVVAKSPISNEKYAPHEYQRLDYHCRVPRHFGHGWVRNPLIANPSPTYSGIPTDPFTTNSTPVPTGCESPTQTV